MDDDYLIVKNKAITRLAYLPSLLTNDYWYRRDPGQTAPIQSGLYRLLVFLTCALNYAAEGLNPIGYHFVDLLLHLLVTWLLYFLAIRRSPSTFSFAHFNRAPALEGLGRFAEAAVSYEHVLSLNPELEDVKRRLRDLRARLGQVEKDPLEHPMSSRCPPELIICP